MPNMKVVRPRKAYISTGTITGSLIGANQSQVIQDHEGGGCYKQGKKRSTRQSKGQARNDGSQELGLC